MLHRWVQRSKKKTTNRSITDSARSFAASWSINRIWFQRLVKESTTSLCPYHLSSWMLRKASPSDNVRSSKWSMKSAEKKSEPWVLNTRPGKCRRASSKISSKSSWESKNKEEQTQRGSLWQRSRHLRHLLLSMREISRLRKRSTSRLSCLQALLSMRHSEQEKFHGEFWFLYIKRWLIQMKMNEINESSEMQSSAFRYRSFHQEWRHRKSKERKKSSSKKMLNKHLLSASSHQFQKQFQISRGSTRSSTTSWRGIRAQQNLLYHNHSNSTSQRTRPTWESTWMLRTKSSIQQRRREQDHTPWTKILQISKKSILQQPRSMKPWSRWEDSTRPTSSLRRQRCTEKIKSEPSSSWG